MKIILNIHNLLKNFEALSFVPLTLIRVYLFFVFWYAGTGKIDNFDKFSGYLGTLGVPLPDILSWMVILTEAGGAALVIGRSFCSLDVCTIIDRHVFCWLSSSLPKWLGS